MRKGIDGASVTIRDTDWLNKRSEISLQRAQVKP